MTHSEGKPIVVWPLSLLAVTGLVAPKLGYLIPAHWKGHSYHLSTCWFVLHVAMTCFPVVYPFGFAQYGLDQQQWTSRSS